LKCPRVSEKYGVDPKKGGVSRIGSRTTGEELLEEGAGVVFHRQGGEKRMYSKKNKPLRKKKKEGLYLLAGAGGPSTELARGGQGFSILRGKKVIISQGSLNKKKTGREVHNKKRTSVDRMNGEGGGCYIYRHKKKKRKKSPRNDFLWERG